MVQIATIPLWGGILITCAVVAELVFVFIFILGWAHGKSRHLVTEAVEKARAGEFGVARHLMIQAARFNSNVRKQNGISAFYDAVIVQDPERSNSLGSILLNISEAQWPRSWQERIALNPVSQFIFFALLVGSVLVRLIDFG